MTAAAVWLPALAAADLLLAGRLVGERELGG